MIPETPLKYGPVCISLNHQRTPTDVCLGLGRLDGTHSDAVRQKQVRRPTLSATLTKLIDVSYSQSHPVIIIIIIITGVSHSSRSDKCAVTNVHLGHTQSLFSVFISFHFLAIFEHAGLKMNIFFHYLKIFFRFFLKCRHQCRGRWSGSQYQYGQLSCRSVAHARRSCSPVVARPLNTTSLSIAHTCARAHWYIH